MKMNGRATIRTVFFSRKTRRGFTESRSFDRTYPARITKLQVRTRIGVFPRYGCTAGDGVKYKFVNSIEFNLTPQQKRNISRCFV